MDKEDNVEIKLRQIINDAILSTLLNMSTTTKKMFEIKQTQTVTVNDMATLSTEESPTFRVRKMWA